MSYEPKPIDTSGVELPEELAELRELLAENSHDHWALQKMSQGYEYGPETSDALKTHADLIPYSQLSESKKEYDRRSAMETLKGILALGFRISKYS